MTTPTRRKKIESMLIDDPQDVTLRYMLAMELDKDGENYASLAMFTKLRDASPPYIPAFFMAAQQLARLERIEDARTILREGIEQARTQGDSHAAGEMSEFLQSLGRAG